VQRSERQCHITWHETPPSPAQEQSWRWLWSRLLGHVDPCPETPQPQDRDSGASSVAAVASGSHIVSEQNNDTTHGPHST